GIPNRCDADNPNWGTFDCDGDGFDNEEDACPTQPGVAGGDGGDGCPEETTGPTCAQVSPCDIEDVDFPCLTAYLNNANELVQRQSLNNDAIIAPTGDTVGYLNSSYEGGQLVVTISPVENFAVSGYVMEVRPTAGSDCVEFACASDIEGEGGSETFINIEEGDSFFIRVKAIICAPVTEG